MVVLQVPLDLGVDSFASQTLRCMRMGGFANVLAVYMITPLILLMSIYVFSLGVLVRRQWSSTLRRAVVGVGEELAAKGTKESLGGDIWREAGLRAAPWMLLLCFLLFPVVSSKACSAFSCEHFDDGSSHLRADYSVDCNAADYDHIVFMAVLAIIICASMRLKLACQARLYVHSLPKFASCRQILLASPSPWGLSSS